MILQMLKQQEQSLLNEFRERILSYVICSNTKLSYKEMEANFNQQLNNYRKKLKFQVLVRYQFNWCQFRAEI